MINKVLSEFSNVIQGNVFSNDIIVFSHLRWQFVFQRPQHIISRLAKDRKILFVEEPVAFNQKNKGTFKFLYPHKNITVLQPRIDWENINYNLVDSLQRYIDKGKIKDPILWFYSPMFVSIVNKISHSLTVYDCMDELSAFKGAPIELIEWEKYLLSKADLVFTGGKKLFEIKKIKHSNIYCYPSSVESNHFKKATYLNTKLPKDIKKIQKPIVGFYGVIDERIDLDLLDKIAEVMPTVSFVMIGPVVKISQKDLPSRKNIYYLGAKSYKELPSYLKAFDIAMMPFAINKATEFISPTKTLEFVSADKPIISTPIYDVVRDYKNVISIIKSTEEFSLSINKYLNENNSAKKKRRSLYKEILTRTSWDRTVYLMKKI